MVGAEALVIVGIIVGMVLVNSLFAAFELSLATVSLGRLKLLADQKKGGAAVALAMKNRMEASLAVVQIGVTLAGATAAATCGAGANEGIAPWVQTWLGVSPGLADALSIAMVVIPLSAATIIVGELVPKSLALRHSEWVCLRLSPLMKGFASVVYPGMVFLEWITRILVGVFERRVSTGGGGQYEIGLAELRAQTQTLRTSRIIGAEQERIILGASTLARVKVSDVLVPIEDVVMLDVNASLGEHLVVAHFDGYTRFPVTEKAGDPQAIIGYVNVKDLLVLAKASTDEVSLRSIVRPMVTVYPDISIGRAFSEMMREHVHLTLVRDSKGAAIGMMTLEDILEEIVGDIQDEYDRLPRHVVPAGGNWIVGGGSSLAQLRESLGRPTLGEGKAPETVLADWLQGHAPRRLKGGDTVAIDGLRILIRKMRRQKVREAMISLEPAT
jgi:putative hemolysin